MSAIIETDRLLLRLWKAEDADAFYQINQDPKVIEFLLGPMPEEAVQEFFARANQQFEKNGYTLLAAEEKDSGKLIGYVGLNAPGWDAHFTPCVEIGWRIGSQYWGKGYATEGAKAILEYGFNQCGLAEIVSFTVPANLRSIRVMEKIGMQRDLSGDFKHPKLAEDHELSQHVLFRIKSRLG